MAIVRLDVYVITVIWYLGYAQHFDEGTHMPAKTVTDVFLESSDVKERYSTYIGHISIRQLKSLISYFECLSLSPFHQLIYITYNYSYGIQKRSSLRLDIFQILDDSRNRIKSVLRDIQYMVIITNQEQL